MRSLENLPECATFSTARLVHAFRLEVERADLVLGLRVSGEIGEVHVVVAAGEEGIPDGAEDPGLVRAEGVGGDFIERAAGFGLVLVVPVTGCTRIGWRRPGRQSGRRGRSFPRRPPGPSRSWRRHGCRL